MNNIKESDTIFLQKLTSLLNSEVKIKSKEETESEGACEALKWQLTRCFEEALKIGALPDDLKFAPFIAEHVDFPIERMKEQIEKPWLKDKFTIGLLGHWSTGKTTAINLILSENLPTNDHENTALAAYLVKGTSRRMSVVTKSGQTLVLKEEDSKALDYESGKRKFPFARIFDYIVKENSSQLLDKLTFIDTPGLGKSRQHSEPTINALQSCDAVIWFVNIQNSISSSDIKFIQENVDKRKLYVVLSFVDDAENPHKSIKTIKDRFSMAGIIVQEYFTLGSTPSIILEFRTKMVNSLKKAAEEYEVYNPYKHIYSVINFLEDTVVNYKKLVIAEYNKLDKETDNLFAAYQRSRQTFVTEFNTCCRIMSNVIDTFNKRCSSAAFCGGASNAICDLLNSYQESFLKMSKADDAIEVKKLAEYGDGTARMNFFDNRSNQATEILEQINKLKKIFD